ncbi:MAG TPA: OmpA family protein [Terriglobia bacterium]|nr:OmpA family protein [Terriglobia bacterium]
MDTSMPMPPGSFIDGVRALVTPSLVSKASATLGESEATITKALGAALSTIFGTLASKADDRGFMGRMFEIIKDPAAESNILGAFSGAGSEPLSTGLTSRFMSTLFGRTTDTVGSALGAFAGVRSSTASSLLSLAGPLALGYLGKTVRNSGMDVSGLSTLLLSHRSAIMRLVPSGLMTVLGTHSKVSGKPAPWQWLTPALLVLLGFGVLVGLVEARNASALVSRSLPGGVQVQYARTGVEERLLGYIEGSSQSVTTDTWLDFDALRFATGSPALEAESQLQLSNIAAILKAYPVVKVMIRGYTDSTGDSSADPSLAQNRANNVMKGLTRLGISAERLSVEGSAEVGEGQTRQVAIRVTER